MQAYHSAYWDVLAVAAAAVVVAARARRTYPHNLLVHGLEECIVAVGRGGDAHVRPQRGGEVGDGQREQHGRGGRVYGRHVARGLEDGGRRYM